MPIWLVNGVTWLIASAAGASISIFFWGRGVGRRQAHIEAEIAAARKSREGIHRRLDEIKQRLEGGDDEMREQLVKIAEQSVRFEAVVERIAAQSAALSQFVPAVKCDEAHRNIERRLDVLEDRKR